MKPKTLPSPSDNLIKWIKMFDVTKTDYWYIDNNGKLYHKKKELGNLDY